MEIRSQNNDIVLPARAGRYFSGTIAAQGHFKCDVQYQNKSEESMTNKEFDKERYGFGSKEKLQNGNIYPIHFVDFDAHCRFVTEIIND